jgi:uncharacterized damage-inducible protein DinB
MLGAFLAQQVRLAHDGPAWHGLALGENLEGISAVQAASRPIPGAHSIWEIVLHMNAWAEEVSRRVGGADPGEPEAGDWPEVGPVSESAWSAARAALRASHEALAQAILDFPGERWQDRVGDELNAPLGTGVTFAAMISGLLQHDGYHGGQVGLLRRALNPGGALVS